MVSRWVCERGRCAEAEPVEGAVLFDAARREGRTLVAYAVSEESPVRTVFFGGEEQPEPVLPAPCWVPQAGLCGQPMVAVDAEAWVVAVRQGRDVVGVWAPDGERWESLTGLGELR